MLGLRRVGQGASRWARGNKVCFTPFSNIYQTNKHTPFHTHLPRREFFTKSRYSDNETHITNIESPNDNYENEIHERNTQFAKEYISRWKNFLVKKGMRYGPAVVSLGSKEYSLQKYLSECKELGLDLKECADFIHNVVHSDELSSRIQNEPHVATFIAEMFGDEGHIIEASQIAFHVLEAINDDTNILYLRAQFVLAQVAIASNNQENTKKMLLSLFCNGSLLENEDLMIEVLRVIGQNDLPIWDEELEDVFIHIQLILEKFDSIPDVIRITKKWAFPLWERLAEADMTDPATLLQRFGNITNNDTENEENEEDEHIPAILHPFILTMAKLDTVVSLDFESKMTMIRKELLLQNYDLVNNPHPLISSAASAIAHQSIFNQGTWEETQEEVMKIQQLVKQAESYLATTQEVSADILNTLSLLAMYRPLSHLKNFEKIEKWDIGNFSEDVKKITNLQVSEALSQKRLAESVPDLAPIGLKNAKVASFYSAHIFPSWRYVGREFWPRLLKDDVEMYYGMTWEGPLPDSPTDQRVLVAGCGTGQDVGLFVTGHPGTQVTALDFSLPSLGYARLQLKRLKLDKDVKFYRGDIEELPENPPDGKQFDMIVSIGVLHHLSDPVAGWRRLLNWLKPGGIMEVGLYSRLARRDCATIRGELAKELTFNPPLFELQETGVGKLLRQPTTEELRVIRNHLMTRPDMQRLQKQSLGELKDMLCHPQEKVYTLGEISAILDNLNLHFVGMLLAEDTSVRQDFLRMFPDDEDMNSIKNWDLYERAKPWTFTGMYLFHCRKPLQSDSPPPINF